MPRPKGAKNKPKMLIAVDELTSVPVDEVIRKVFGEVVYNARMDREKAMNAFRELMQKAEDNDDDIILKQCAKDFLKIAQGSNSQLITIYTNSKNVLETANNEEEDTDWFKAIEEAEENNNDE